MVRFEAAHRVHERFTKEAYHARETALPTGTLAGHIARDARACGLLVRAAYGIGSPSDFDGIDTVLVDLFHPTSEPRGLEVRMNTQRERLKSAGIVLTEAALLHLCKDDPYVLGYGAFFEKLIEGKILESAKDAVVLEGFDGKVAALGRDPALPHLGTTLVVYTEGQGRILVQSDPFLSDRFSSLVVPRKTLGMTYTGMAMTLELAQSQQQLFHLGQVPHVDIEGGIPRQSLYGVDAPALYEAFKGKIIESTVAHHDVQTHVEFWRQKRELAVQRAQGIISDLGRVVSGHRNVFALYGKFDIMAWEEPCADGRHLIEQHLPGRKVLVVSPQRVYTPEEIDDRFMFQARALQTPVQQERP